MKNSKITISSSDKLNLISNISTMLSAGIPILETVDSLLEDAKGNTKKILQKLRDDLIQGKHIYSSLAEYPRVFNKVTVNIIRAAEEAGTLDISLKDLKEQIKKDIEFNDKIRGALTYPILIFFVFSAVLLLILLVVIPKVATVFLNLHVVLPLPTKVLIAASSAMLTYPLPILLGTIIVIACLVYLFKAKRQIILGLLYKLPIVSNLVKEIDLARFSRSMYLLLSSGITINNALELSQEVVQRQDIASAIGIAKENVLSGRELSEGFKERKQVFPSLMVKIIEAGEKTGTLDKSMQDISEHMDYEVGNALKTMMTILEPLMLVIVGILVGGMMLSIIAPIYSIIGQVGTH